MNKKNSLDLYIKKPVKEQVSIIGVPFEEGSGATGLAEAPDYLRELGIVPMLRASGLKVKDCGNAKFNKSVGKGVLGAKESAINMAKSAATLVRSELKSGHKVLAIGGDHGVSLGTIAGASLASKHDLGLVWIDAHPDLCTWEESLTKNIHGMQAAALLGYGDNELVNATGKGVKIKKQNIIYIGLKDMDDCEIRFLQRNKINVITIHDIESKGIRFAHDELAKFVKNQKSLWVSLDMDGIEKRYVPSSPMATDEGLTAREVLSLARSIGRSGKVVGADIVEFAKKGDVSNQTGLLAIDLVAKLFGSDRGWYERYMSDSINES